MKYLIRDCRQRAVACLLFGSSAWRVKSRNIFIVWCDKARRTGLMYTTNNNMRFLILPWVRIDNLASHILSLIVRRIDHDRHFRYPNEVTKGRKRKSRADATQMLGPQVLTGNLEARDADMRMTDGHSDRAFKFIRNVMIRARDPLPFT